MDGQFGQEQTLMGFENFSTVVTLNAWLLFTLSNVTTSVRDEGRNTAVLLGSAVLVGVPPPFCMSLIERRNKVVPAGKQVRLFF